MLKLTQNQRSKAKVQMANALLEMAKLGTLKGIPDTITFVAYSAILDVTLDFILAIATPPPVPPKFKPTKKGKVEPKKKQTKTKNKNGGHSK